MPWCFRPLAYLPSGVSHFIYTVVLKPAPVRALAHWVLRRFVIPSRMQINGMTLLLNPQDAVISSALALGCYERFEVGVFASLAKPGDVVYDIGANIGLYSMVASQAVGRSGTVIALEPESVNFGFLSRTVARNGLHQVRCFNVAAGNRTGVARLFLCEDNKGDHRVYESEAERACVDVPMTTIDALRDAEGIAAPSLIKIDIQGAELWALQGMTQTLRDASPAVLMEFWPWGLQRAGCDPAEVLRLMRSLGYQIFEVRPRRQDVALVDSADDGVLLGRHLERQYTNLLVSRLTLDTAALAAAGRGFSFETPVRRSDRSQGPT